MGTHFRHTVVQGFPRADVDIYRARALRQEHICLRNDHKAIMAELHDCITSLHQAAQRAGNATEGTRSGSAPAAAATAAVASAAPFARVNLVEARSPAAVAGLQEGDVIVQFGSIAGGAGGVQAVASQLPVRPQLIPCCFACSPGSDRAHALSSSNVWHIACQICAALGDSWRYSANSCWNGCAAAFHKSDWQRRIVLCRLHLDTCLIGPFGLD